MTESEKQVIIDAVLSALRTNSRTIEQLTPVASLSASDYFEVNGGRRIAYTVLAKLIATLSESEQSNLQAAIDRKELQSVAITTTQSSATLTIKSVGKTISCSIPISTTSQAGFITAADKVKLDSAYNNADSALTQAKAAQTTANNAKSAADTANSGVSAINSKIGKANGIAPLDESGKVPAANLPGYVDDVVEFNAIVTGITSQMASSSKKSTDSGCMVVYNADTNRFVLAVSNRIITDGTNWDAILRPQRLANNPTPAIVGGEVTKYEVSDYWEIKGDNVALITSIFTYYNNWADAYLFGETADLDGRIPVAGKIYTCTSENKTFRWSGSELIAIGSDLALGHVAGSAFPGDEGAQLQEQIRWANNGILDNAHRIDVIGILPADGQWDGNGSEPTSGVWLCPNEDEYDPGLYFRSFGNTNFYNIAEETYNSDFTYNSGWLYRLPDGIYRINNDKLESISGSAVGNTYNATVEIPLPTGEYYSDINAEVQSHNVLQAILKEGVASLGLQITFAIGASSWKTYQYVGPNLTDTQFLNPANWVDLAGMSAGAEAIINVDALCPRTVAGYYTKDTAIDAILAEQTKSGINYAKGGLVITYRTGEYTWETYQFTGQPTDFASKDLWKEFGGGGSVKTSDTPEKDGKEALSTGGAYEMEQKSFAGLEITPDPDDYIIQGVDKTGNAIGEAVKIPKSNGAGGATGSTLSIYPDNPAPYAAFGSDIIVNAAIRSVSYDGGEEIAGVIRKVEIIDATSGLSLWSENINQNSSTSATNYSFKFDFTPYFTEAAAKDFTLVAYDAEGNIKRRTITVTAVDVTCTSVQTLNYTTSSALEVGGTTKNLLMYKFANNVSKQGVKVFTEMFYNGEWRSLGVATITDSYSHSISIDPCNVFGGGERLGHGSYPVRVYGEDVASGVTGNTIYTSVMCVDSISKEPIVALRFNDANNGVVRLYDNLEIEVAAYTPGKNSTTAEVYIDGKEVTSVECQISQTYPVRKQIQGYATDGSATIEVYAQNGNSQTYPITVKVIGSAINAIIKEGALFGYDFSTRSNSEPDHTISNGGFEMSVEGSNWSSNGFATYLGENCLRIAENVKATIPYAPFGTAATERTNGMAFQFAFATNNIKDDTAKLMECFDSDSGTGFYVTGNEIVLYCKTGTPSTITRSFKCGEKYTVGIVVEPSTITVRRGSTEYATIKLYVDGEEIGAIGYVANSGAILNTKHITFDGTEGDFYLYYTLAYDSYYEWAQAFQNYLCKLTDTEAMIAEYDKENVLDNQNRPSMSLLKEKGIPYYVVVAPQATFDTFDGDIDTSTKFECTLYYFHPTLPWRSFKAEHVQWRRQGTTSAKRPIKNDRFYLRKNSGWKVTPLNPEYTNADALKTYELFDLGYIRIGVNTIPIAIITVKVDYSDSSMANDCGVCDMMNATFRALGSNYMTPAQRAFDGTWTKSGVKVTDLEMNHSTANHPIAAFRATSDSLADAWFHARGNWKEDKGEQVALGFQDTPGYNLGCMNYGSFIEFFGKPQYDNSGKYVGQETLDQIMARFKTTEGLDTSKPYILSQYCGRDYRVMRFSGGEWARSTGSMKQVGGKWIISGDVLNPVSGFELITYDAMDWFMGVGSVDDMMAPVKTQSSWVSKLNLGQETYPAWTQYFECMVDDDQLQEDLAMGRKVPYELYNVLQFCDSCDYSKAELAATWKKLWRENAWRYMSIQSLLAYYTFTDYLAAVDQQAKNMQPMFFLEDGSWVENGEYHSPSSMEPLRMYFNKVYDCDTCNGKDNDGGNTIPAELNPEEDDKCYAGRGSILWNNLRRCDNQEMIADASGNVLTLPGVVGTMRNLPEVDGIGAGPFSPKGAQYYFVQKRIEMWPKVVCTFDCERKYIKYSETYTDIYYYALHGSGRQSLPRFIEQRWRVRDGYYQTGDFKDASHVLGGRIGAKTGAVIRFRAGKSGYYGIGNDGGNVTQGMYLKAGEEGVFTDFQHGDNILLYIYQADQMSEIDLSQISIDPNFQFSQMKLAEKIVIGSDTHKDLWRLSPGNTGFLTNMNLGDLPFLRYLDVRTTEVTTINAAKCPRLEEVYAKGSDLSTITLAETSPIFTLQLPATMTDLSFVNLPNLSYPGGLTIEGMSSVIRLMLAGCPNIDPMTLINGIVTSSNVRYIRLPDVNITAPSSILYSLQNSGAIGLDPSGQAYEESGRCSGITGRWIMSDLIEDSALAAFGRYFPQLILHNSQFSIIKSQNDDNDESNKMTNLDNNTGRDFNTPFVQSGHLLAIEKDTHTYKCTYNEKLNRMEGEELDDNDFNFFADGSSIDLTDNAGEGYDIMWHLCHCWYKGINDYKNQAIYYVWSHCVNEPISTASKCVRKAIGDLLYKENCGVYVNDAYVGTDVDDSISTAANMNTYRMDVEGMKQVRWPGINMANLGGVFTDENGKVIKTFKMSISNAQFDFDGTRGDYIFTDVPAGAKWFFFTTFIVVDQNAECIAVDSSSVEAIEPDWVEHKAASEEGVECEGDSLIGNYPITMDALSRPRSVSSTGSSQRGTGTSTTAAWEYDADGNPTAIPTGTLNYTMKDFENLAWMRGPGFQLIDYEQHKETAILWWCCRGRLNEQAVVGNGQSGGRLNQLDNIGMRDSTYNGNNFNSLMGLKAFIGCNNDWMTNIAVNVTSYLDYKKRRGVEFADFPLNHIAHIYDPISKTERTLTLPDGSGDNVLRLIHGRRCDILPSRVDPGDRSKYVTDYCAGYWYSNSRSRVLLRSCYNANANSGFACALAYYASSYSSTSYGARLAFRGTFVIVKAKAR